MLRFEAAGKTSISCPEKSARHPKTSHLVRLSSPTEQVSANCLPGWHEAATRATQTAMSCPPSKTKKKRKTKRFVSNLVLRLSDWSQTTTSRRRSPRRSAIPRTLLGGHIYNTPKFPQKTALAKASKQARSWQIQWRKTSNDDGERSPSVHLTSLNNSNFTALAPKNS